MLKRFLHSSCLLLFFFSAHFVVFAQQPVLKSVSIDTIFPQQIKISWMFDEYIDSVTIYKCTNNCHIEDNFYRVAKVEMSELEWIDMLSNPLSQNYYSVGWEWSGKSAPNNNMFLKAVPATDGCLNSVSFSWNPYINMLDTLSYYNVFYRKVGDDMPLFELLASTERADFTAKLLENLSVYEFVVQAVNKTNSVFSFSNIIKDSTGTVLDIPVNVSITHVSVDKDITIEIEVKTDEFPDPLNFKNLYLLRKDSINYRLIDSLPYSSNNEYYFSDVNVDVKSQLYYYQAIVDNQCKANDISNVVTNILLTGSRVEEEKYKDSISFYQVGFDLSETFDLLINGSTFPMLFPLTLENNKYLVDVEKLMKDGLAVTYQIKSKRDCYSNILSIEHEPVVYFANAFYPQATHPADKTFYPIIYFPSEDNYLFIIYNRQGQELYRSSQPPVFKEYDNMEGRWDGTFRGQDCPAGVYAYKLSYNYNNGQRRYSKSGSFMLVR